MSDYWGWEMVIDLAGCEASAIRSKDTITAFSKQLVNDIDMVAFGEPMVVHFGEGNKEGYTLVQLIETSNICGHFNNLDNSGFLNVFSCKTFDPETVMAVINQYFKPLRFKTHFITRKAPV